MAHSEVIDDQAARIARQLLFNLKFGLVAKIDIDAIAAACALVPVVLNRAERVTLLNRTARNVVLWAP